MIAFHLEGDEILYIIKLNILLWSESLPEARAVCFQFVGITVALGSHWLYSNSLRDLKGCLNWREIAGNVWQPNSS